MAGRELVAQALDPAADARVDAERARLEDDPADQRRVDPARRLDRPPRGLLDLAGDRVSFLVGELVRGRQLDVEAPLRLRDEQVELAVDLLDLPGAPLLGDE